MRWSPYQGKNLGQSIMNKKVIGKFTGVKSWRTVILSLVHNYITLQRRTFLRMKLNRLCRKIFFNFWFGTWLKNLWNLLTRYNIPFSSKYIYLVRLSWKYSKIVLLSEVSLIIFLVKLKNLGVFYLDGDFSSFGI